MSESNQEKVERFRAALDQLIERATNDRYILAVVQVGSLTEETIWRKESLWVWIIEADGVSKRLRSDGNDERVFRILVEDNLTIHAEVIPRSRFKQMVEGTSRTAFSCNLFATRELVYCDDPSISNWFETANTLATKDQQRELLTFSTWTIHAQRHAENRLHIKKDVELAAQEVLWAAHSVAHTEIIRHGQICEQDVIYRATELSPDLFQVIYIDVLAKRKNTQVLAAALQAIDDYLVENHTRHLKPLLDYFTKNPRVVPLSEISDHFAFSEVYPWHIESACDWLERKGHLEKLSAPFKLTKRSREELEEPAYLMDS